MIFQSAGNDRSDNPSAGQTVALSPGSSTVVSYDPAIHPGGDGSYRSGFENIGFRGLAKNIVTVGSVNDAVTSGGRDVSKATMSNFSSWGPTDDGRIKPDLVANGAGLYSSLNGSNTSYGTYNGTSMSSPNACGSAALLVQQYAQLFSGGAMRAATLKGLLIHTADDLGKPGPDYKNGWGLINTKAAADLLTDHQANPLKLRLTEDQVTTSATTRSYPFVWDGTTPIRATLSWTDPAGSIRCQFNLTDAATGLWSVVTTNPDASSATLVDAFTVIGAIWSENFDGSVSGWTSNATTGSNSWSLATTKSHSTTKSYFAPPPAWW